MIFHSPNILDNGRCSYYPHFAEKEIEAQRASIICPESPSGMGDI